MGTTGALRVLLGLGLLFPAVMAWQRQPRGALWGAGFVLAFVLLPGQEQLWTRLHGVTDTTRPSFIGEDADRKSVV